MDLIFLIEKDSKSPVIFTDTIDLKNIKKRDVVKVRLCDKDENYERFWIYVIDMKKKKNELVSVTGIVTNDLRVLDIPYGSAIEVSVDKIIDHQKSC